MGLPGPEIIESCERVRAAIEGSGFEFPRRRILVNLSPAGIRKEGTGTDLAIALGVLCPPCEDLVVASGELGLDGRLGSAGKVMRTCLAAVRSGASRLLFSTQDRSLVLESLQLIAEAGEGPKAGSGGFPAVHFAATLAEALEALHSPAVPWTPATDRIPEAPVAALAEDLLAPEPSLMRRILAASAGSHSMLLLGPKGTGKTESLRWLSYLQPGLSASDRVHRRVLEELVEEPGAAPAPIAARPPVREVSPQVRAEALVGGILRGQLRPGEFTLANGGLLVADEFLEWRRDAREALRDPLESGRVVLSRDHKTLSLPARFVFAASANLCPCGGWPQELATTESDLPPCHCSPKLREAYLERLSGPILDRIDLVACVTRAPASAACLTATDSILEQLARARAQLLSLWGALPGRLAPQAVEDLIRGEPALSDLQSRWGSAECSLRRRHREIRLALTLAALDGLPIPEARHFREARPFALKTLLTSACSRPMRAKPVSALTPASRSLTPFAPIL